MVKRSISAKDMVRKFNIPYHTVNYYTVMGLLPLVGKEKNQRFYDEEEAGRRLKQISQLSREGYPLNLIRKKIVGF
jgi:DNA-binding transcriptional MerR regulator